MIIMLAHADARLINIYVACRMSPIISILDISVNKFTILLPPQPDIISGRGACIMRIGRQEIIRDTPLLAIVTPMISPCRK